MDIDLGLLNSNVVDSIDISGDYIINKEYFKDSDISSLNNIHVDGVIIKKENDNYELDYYINCIITGEMIIPDSISLDMVNYPFSIEYDDFIDEKCLKDENLLDIFEFLWENIVLEVPLQFTRVKDLSKFHGDGWKLVSEDELNNDNNPFRDLLKDFEKE